MEKSRFPRRVMEERNVLPSANDIFVFDEYDMSDPATSMVVTLHRRAHSLSVEKAADEISAEPVFRSLNSRSFRNLNGRDSTLWSSLPFD